MAITFSNLGANANPDINDGANSTSYSNSSWTPPTSGLIIAFCFSRHGSGLNGPPTVSGNSLTWTQIATMTYQGGDCRITLFAADASGSATGATTFDFGSDTQVGCDVSFFHASGVDLSGGVAGAFVQTASNSGSSGSPSVTLSSPANSNNRAIAFFSHLANESQSPRTNWTELDDLSGTGPNRGNASQYRGDAFETTASATWSNTGVDWGGLAAELKEGGAATAVLEQTSYRIRSGDTVSLNADSDWAAALNTAATIDAGGRFRVRFVVTETDAVSVSTAFDFQYRRKPNGGSFGSWANCPIRGTPVADMPVQVLASNQYDDGDATTAVLSSGTGFVAGDGNENIATASVTLNDQHTEFEFCVMLLGTWGGPSRAVSGDVLEFRLVKSGGAALDTYTNTPSVTVNMPAGYIGSPTIESPGRIGPFKDGNGNLYLLIEPVGKSGAGNNEPEILKSTDGGDSWALVDTANSPAENDLESVDCFQAGDTLHILIQSGGSGNPVTYHTFRTSDHSTNADTWGIVDESVAASPGSADQGCGIVVRSDNTVVAFYRYLTGGNQRVAYKIRSSGGSWGSENNLDNTTSANFVFSSCVLGASDKTHIFYRDQSNNDIYHKSLSSSDTLSSRELVEADAQSGSDRWGTSPAIYWDSSGDEKVMVMVQDGSDNILYSVVITNDGTPETRKQVSDGAVIEHPPGALSHQPVADLVIDPDTDTAYALFAYSSDGDLYLDTAVNDGGWGTDSLQITAINIDYVRGNIFTHSVGNGGAKVYAYIYEDDGEGDEGFSWYTEYEIATGGAALTEIVGSTLQVSEARLRSLGLRRVVNETAQVVEGTLRNLGLVRLVNETVEIGEGTLRVMGLVRILGEDVEVGETAVFLRGLLRQVAESVAIGETTLRVLGFVRVLDEVVQVGEGSVRILGLLRVVNESVSIGEGVLRNLGLVRLVNESVGLNEGTLRVMGLVRILGEDVEVGETAVFIRGLLRQVAESVAIGETTGRVLGFVRLVDEVVQVGEGTLRFRGLLRVVDESISVVEVASYLRGRIRAVGETVSVGEGVLRNLGLVRLVNETVEIGEGTLRMLGLVRILGEDVEVGETAVFIRGLLRQVAESVAIEETTGRVLGFVRGVDETVNIGEGTVRIVGFVRVVNEVVNIGEAVGYWRGLVRLVGEVVGVNELVLRSRELVRQVVEAVAVSESVLRVMGLVRILGEVVGVGETAVYLRGLVRQVTAVVGIGETVARLRGLVRGVDETVTIEEVVQRLLVLAAAVDEAVALFKGMLRGMFRGGR